jgi:hypothetical protein
VERAVLILHEGRVPEPPWSLGPTIPLSCVLAPGPLRAISQSRSYKIIAEALQGSGRRG